MRVHTSFSQPLISKNMLRSACTTALAYSLPHSIESFGRNFQPRTDTPSDVQKVKSNVLRTTCAQVTQAKRISAALICTSQYAKSFGNTYKKHTFVPPETTFVPAQNQRELQQTTENTHLYLRRFHLYFARCHGTHVRVDFSTQVQLSLIHI